MRQIVRTAQLVQVPENNDFRVLKMFHRAFDGLVTSFSFVLAGAYVPLIVSCGGRKKKTS